MKVLDLKPTQFAIGMLEVDEKIAIVKKMKRREREAWVKENPIPVVISPEGDAYILDHHHFLFVCYHFGIKKVPVIVKKDLSAARMTYSAFWKWMFKKRNAYPFCQFGEGPREALYLPHDIRGLADDPYRSLAWFVRKAGAFQNSDKNFAEFKWANFFRSKRLLAKRGIRGFPEAMVKAAALAQSEEAQHLPGYGKLNLGEKAALKKKIKKKQPRALMNS